MNSSQEKSILYGIMLSIGNRLQITADRQFEDITAKQHFLLISLCLFDEPPMLTEMSSVMGCSYQNVKQLVSALERKGYLRVEPDTADRRKLRLCTTEKCSTLFEQLQQLEQDFLAQMYQGIAAEDIAVTRRTLEQINQNLGGDLRDQLKSLRQRNTEEKA